MDAKLVWTDAKPTAPGWYWWRATSRTSPTMVYVKHRSFSDDRETLYVFNRGPLSEVPGQFAGPIPLPTEAK